MFAKDKAYGPDHVNLQIRDSVPLLVGDSHVTSFVFSGNNSLPATGMEPSSPIP